MTNVTTWYLNSTGSLPFVPSFHESWYSTSGAIRIAGSAVGDNAGIQTVIKTCSNPTASTRSFLMLQVVFPSFINDLSYDAFRGAIRGGRLDGPDPQSPASRSQIRFSSRYFNSSGVQISSPVQIGVRTGDSLPVLVDASRNLENVGLLTHDKMVIGGTNAVDNQYTSVDWGTSNIYTVVEIGFQMSYAGTLQFQLKYGHSSGLPLLDISNRAADGNAFLRLFEYVARTANGVRVRRPVRPLCYPDRITSLAAQDNQFSNEDFFNGD